MKTSHDSEIPAHGQQVISVTGFIHKKDRDKVKVFLPKRAETKKFLPGVWEMPGGHVDYGEDIVEALRREVMEEFGKKIEVGDPFACFTYVNKVKGSHSIEVIYFAKFLDDSKINMNPEDHSEYRWFTKNEVVDCVVSERQLSKRAGSVGGTAGEDFEMKSVLKGFSILEGEPLNTMS